ncbi:MAG: hypothetical protein CR982_09525 [Candidatus Cloacimonadota bacterium]|nr:MAG: hypothetical protein CR982_09525 [Candidatus Cloacimonadota bacterium]PIE79279.1 MAG: hypothetical protein CSA15_03700 [Candidatus Delongbacteria bacterium]
MKISLLQTSVNEKDYDQNLEKCFTFLSKVEKGSTAVLPELFIPGYREENIIRCGKESKKIIEKIQSIAKTKEINIIAGTISVLDNGNYFNRSISINKMGKVLSFYNKTHLFKMLSEDIYFKEGENFPVFEMEKFNCGVEICYDLRFPEVSRIYYNKGVNLIFIPAAWPHNRVEVFKKLLVTRAIENQCYIVGVNRASDKKDNLTYGGSSMVVSPEGNIVDSCGVLDEIKTVSININKVNDYRKNINCMEDRRDDLFTLKEV